MMTLSRREFVVMTSSVLMNLAGGIVTAGSEAGPTATSTTGLKLQSSIALTVGNSQHVVWAPDSSAVYNANGDESGITSAFRITPSGGRGPHASGVANLWSASYNGPLLVMRDSNVGRVTRFDPTTMATIWSVYSGSIKGHQVVTDGTYVYCPNESSPGQIHIFDSGGTPRGTYTSTDNWPASGTTGVYGIAYEATTKRLYLGVTGNGSPTSPGGVYIFDVSTPKSPSLLGRVSNNSTDLAVYGTTLYRTQFLPNGQGGGAGVIEKWNCSTPGSPKLISSHVATAFDPGTTRGNPIVFGFGDMSLTPDGSKLWITYASYLVKNANQALDAPAGVLRLDTSTMTVDNIGNGPTRGIEWNPGYGIYMSSLLLTAVSPDATKLAVSYNNYGVRIYDVTRTPPTILQQVPTLGENHDIYRDAAGYSYCFDNAYIIPFSPNGTRLPEFVTGHSFDGGWRPFKDGNIILPNKRNVKGTNVILSLNTGKIRTVDNFASVDAFDFAFSDPNLYAVGPDGLYIYTVGTYSGGHYPFTLVGRAAAQNGQYYACWLNGTQLWVLTSGGYVMAYDASKPSSPVLISQGNLPDNVRFNLGGGTGYHVGLTSSHGRIYAACGNKGVRIYDPTTLTKTGGIGEPIGEVTQISANFLDVYKGRWLLVANYWFPAIRDGLYVYDLNANADNPPLYAYKRYGEGDFRTRAFDAAGVIYGLSLYYFEVYKLS